MRTLVILTLLCCSLRAQEFIPYFSSLGNNLTPNLLAFWRFDEASGNATDSSGNGRTLTQQGTVSVDAGGVVNGARSYTSANAANYFDRATESVFSFTNNAFTITSWCAFAARALDANDMTVLARGQWTDTNLCWWLELDHGSPDDFVTFYYTTDGVFDISKNVSFQCTGEIGTGYNFIVVRWDGANLHISVSNISAGVVASDTTAAFAGSFYENGTAKLYAGGTGSGGDAIHSMQGLTDEHGIWARYLSDCEVGKLYSARAGSFSFPNFDSSTCSP